MSLDATHTESRSISKNLKGLKVCLDEDVQKVYIHYCLRVRRLFDCTTWVQQMEVFPHWMHGSNKDEGLASILLAPLQAIPMTLNCETYL